MKRKLIHFALTILAILAFTHLTALAGTLPLSQDAINEYASGDIPVPANQEGTLIIEDLVLGTLEYLKVIMVVVGIMYVTILGFNLVTSAGNEDKITNSKKGLIYAIIAFAMVSMAEDIARIFDMRDGTILGSPQAILERVRLFDRQAEIAILFIKNTVGAFATVLLIRAGLKLVTAGGNEEEVGRYRKTILYSGGGLLLIYVGDIFINRVFYRVNKQVYSGITGVHPQIDVKEGIEQIVGITNFIITLVAPVAVLMLIAAALMYVMARGEEEQLEKAKRLIFATVIGLGMIYGAFAIVNTVISSELTEIGAL